MSVIETGVIDADLRAVAKKPWWRVLLSGTAAYIFILDVILIIAFGIFSHDNVFWSIASIQSLMLSGTEALLLSLALAILLGSGIFDLSLGANLVLSSVVGGLAIKAVAGTPLADGSFPHPALAIVVGIVVAVGTGALYGLINGLVVAYLDINSLIATLGTTGLGTGLALILTSGGDITGLPTQLQSAIGLNTIGGIFPLPAVLAIVIAVLVALMLRYTRFGLRSLAMGSSRPSAERAGIKTARQIVSLAALGGALAGFAGFIDLSRFGGTTVSGHAQDALTAVTAVIIGGTLLEGGRVSIIGAIWGTVLSVVLASGLIIIGVSAFYQLMAVGFVLIVAVAIDRVRTKRQKA